MYKKTFAEHNEIQQMVYNTLVNKTMGLTVNELRRLTYFDAAQINSATQKLKERGLIHVTGFKSGKRNGQGSGIYQVVQKNAALVPVSRNTEVGRVRMAAKRKATKKAKYQA